MATNKDSFILYCKYIHQVEKISVEQAGKLFKHILRYVNDLNPVIDDLIIDLLFEGIKQDLKTDLKKWEATCKRNQENGSKGGRPKNPNKPKEPTGLLKNPYEPKKPDSDSDCDCDCDYEEKIKKDNITPLPSFSEKPKKEEKEKTWKNDFNIYLQDATDALAKLKQNNEWMQKQQEFNPTILIIETLDKSFYNYWGTEAGWKNKKDSRTKDINWKSTYANALSNPVNKVYKPKDNSQPTTFYKNSKGQLLHETEWIENGKRYYGKRGGKCYEVPMDLEPRPNTQFSLVFNNAQQRKVWVIN
jgi:hypothetical protein